MERKLYMKWEDKATSKGGFDLGHPGRREAAACPQTTRVESKTAPRCLGGARCFRREAEKEKGGRRSGKRRFLPARKVGHRRL